MAITIACHHQADAYPLGIASQSRRRGPALKRDFLCWSDNGMKVVCHPDRLIAILISRVCHACQRFICFHRIFDACQIHKKTHRKEDTILERHTYLALSLLASRKLSTEPPTL